MFIKPHNTPFSLVESFYPHETGKGYQLLQKQKKRYTHYIVECFLKFTKKASANPPTRPERMRTLGGVKRPSHIIHQVESHL